MPDEDQSTKSSYKSIILVSVTTSLLTFGAVGSLGGIVVYTHRNQVADLASSFLVQNGAGGASLGTVNRDVASEESRVIDIVDKTNPAVVSIVISKDVPVLERYYQNYDPFGNDVFNNLFGNEPSGNGFQMQIPRYRQNGTQKQEVGGGSGFFVSSDGYIVTNKHVVDDPAADYTVLTNDGEKYEAKILAKDPVLDIAILKVDKSNLPYLQLGSSDSLKAGQTVIAIGNALAEFRNSVSVGVVSGLARSITAGDYSGNSETLEGVIQTDAAINPGNSGGPLLDLRGEVIGVNVAVEQGAQNIGFALPSTAIEGIIDSVKEHGEIIRPYLGVRYTPVTEEIQKANHLSVDYGVLIQRGETIGDLAVVPGSPADKAGLVENDIILEVDGVKLDQDHSLSTLIRQKEVGQTISLKIWHKGEEKQVNVTLEKAPKDL